MQTKTHTTVKFEEASDGLKAKILDNYRYINVENGFWYDYDGKMGFSQKELNRMHVKVNDAPDELISWKNLYFDLDRSWYIQFIGANFKNDEIARKFLRVPADIWNHVSWSFNNSWRDSSTKLEYDWDGDKELTKRQEKILDRACEIFSDKVKDALKGLRDTYEYQFTDEAVKETLVINEYEFDESGHID